MLRLAVLGLLLAAPLDALAQRVRASDIVSWRVRAEVAAPGGEARLVFDAQIDEGWRLYALQSPVGRPLDIEIEALPAGLTLGTLRQSPPRTGYDAGFEMDYPYFSDRARLAQTVRVDADAPDGTRTLLGTVSFTVCDDSVCLPPSRVPFRVPFVVRSP